MAIQILTDEQLKNNLEIVLDKIAEAMIIKIGNYSTNPVGALYKNQKTIQNGIIQTLSNGLTPNDILVLYQKDTTANPKDLQSFEQSINWNESGNELLNNPNGVYGQYDIVGLTALVDSWGDIDVSTITVTITGNTDQDSSGNVTGIGTYKVDLFVSPLAISFDITNMVVRYEVDDAGNLQFNPPNISQFINLGNQFETIDSAQANEYLNTNIYELLPSQRTRQERVDDFFKEYQVLKGTPPNWTIDPITGDLSAPNYYFEHDISATQDNPDEATIIEQNSFITRLDIDANTGNSAKTLQYLRNDLNRFLEDIDQEAGGIADDERPEYINKLNGYLKIRNLNQGIIVRKQDGGGVGLENLVEVLEGDSHVVNNDYIHPHHGETGPSYLMEGFTITEWVRFLDKTSTGTLFNYGNPVRELDPKGFRLETYVLNKNEVMETDELGRTWGEYAGELGLPTFQDNDYARFIRLLVYDHIPDKAAPFIRKLHDSRLGKQGLPRVDNSVPELNFQGSENWQKGDEKNLLGHVQIPIDFEEWFFIVATYNPLIEPRIDDYYKENEYYWRGNINPNEQNSIFTQQSGFGSKCKVEVISRSDLLRARGYRV